MTRLAYFLAGEALHEAAHKKGLAPDDEEGMLPRLPPVHGCLSLLYKWLDWRARATRRDMACATGSTRTG